MYVSIDKMGFEHDLGLKNDSLKHDSVMNYVDALEVN